MRHLVVIIISLLPALATADVISDSVPSVVREAVDGWCAECTNSSVDSHYFQVERRKVEKS